MAAGLLIVEDSDADFEAIVRALRRAGSDIDVERAHDAGEARRNLLAFDPADGSLLPVVILLDLHLPDSDGREVLSEVKRSELLRQLPVIIFSTSDSPTVIADCYRLGAGGYMVKPHEFGEFEGLIKALHDYWLQSVALPYRSET